MYDVGATIRKLILTDASIASSVSSRVYSDHLVQGAELPAIVFRVISEVANEHLGGVVGVDQARIQIECYATSRPSANELMYDVRNLLATYRGSISGVYLKTVSQASGHRYLTDRAEAGSDYHRFITSQDFFVFYTTS